MKIVVIGMGYVGMANAVLLATNNEVVAVDISKEKVDLINELKSPIGDVDIEKYLENKKLNLSATVHLKDACKDCDYVIISTPTNYDEDKKIFDTKSIEKVIENVLECNKNVVFVIKSTIPIGFVKNIINKYKYENILFLPEFLREGKALYDNLYPSRIVVGVNEENADLLIKAKVFANLMTSAAIKKDVDVLFMNYTEAESVKLFANTYLAMRVSYFNELDTFAEKKGLNAGQIIKGISLDPRIGDYYNNPSFGYGGYCLPKDTKQLLSNYMGVPNNIMESIVESNNTRKKHIAQQILEKNPKIVGIYRLAMKQGSDNFRVSSIQSVMEIIKKSNVKVVVYEPVLKISEFCECEVIDDISLFKRECDIILTNRYNDELSDVIEKVYTRDLYFRD